MSEALAQTQTSEAPAQAQTTNQAAPVETNPASNQSSETSHATNNEAPQDTPPPAPVEQQAATPEWFMKDKFANEIEQAKAYPELLKKMGKNWGPPRDDYAIDGIEGIPKDDPLLQHLKPAIKDLGLSQDGFNQLVKSYHDAHAALGTKMQEQLKQELTQKEAITVQAVDKWLDNSFAKEDADTMRSWILSIKDFKLLNQLRTMLPTATNVPSSTQGVAAHFETTTEVNNEKIKYRKEVNSGIKVPDKNYENDLQRRWRDAHQRENYNKKR